MKSVFFILFVLGALKLAAQSSSDIVLLKLSENESAVMLSNPQVVTSGNAYHNQPFFRQNEHLLYTAQQEDGNMEIIQLNLENGSTQNLTNTEDSEYSAHLTPDGQSFVTVRVESDGKQRLWQYDLAGNRAPKVVFEEIAPVGYFAINASQDVLMFVLGSPNTLQLANLKDTQSRILGQNVGRTFRVVPGTEDFVYQQNASGKAAIYKLNIADESQQKVVDLPSGATDWTITQDGTYLTSTGSRIWAYHPKHHDDWEMVKDLGESATKGVTRMAINQNNTYLALVVNR